MIFQAKNFKTRAELEDRVREFGLTPELKGHSIEGTKEELARLHLSQNTVFWGIKCVETDTLQKPDILAPPRPDRGEKHDFGINQTNNKPKNI